MDTDSSTEKGEARKWCASVTSAVASDLLPRGMFENSPMAPGAPGPSPDLAMIENGYVMIDQEWSGMASHEDGWLPWFPQEMVWHHCRLRTLLELELFSPEISQAVVAVAQLERACVNAHGDPPFLESLDSKRREALTNLDHHLDIAVAANDLEGTVQDIYSLLATADPGRALRIQAIGHTEPPVQRSDYSEEVTPLALGSGQGTQAEPEPLMRGYRDDRLDHEVPTKGVVPVVDPSELISSEEFTNEKLFDIFKQAFMRPHEIDSDGEIGLVIEGWKVFATADRGWMRMTCYLNVKPETTSLQMLELCNRINNGLVMVRATHPEAWTTPGLLIDHYTSTECGVTAEATVNVARTFAGILSNINELDTESIRI